MPSARLTIREVPACPHLSLSSVARTLGRINSDSDMANYTVHTSTAADYNYGNTAEEFFNGSPKSAPKSHPATASAPAPAPAVIPADGVPASLQESDLLADPALTPSLKKQIIILRPSPAPSASDNFKSQISNLKSAPPSFHPPG